jgi:hypothetical protein
MIGQRLKGFAAAAKMKKTMVAASSWSSWSLSKLTATHKAVVPAPASVPAPALVAKLTVELERVGGAASRLLAAAHGSDSGDLGGSPALTGLTFFVRTCIVLTDFRRRSWLFFLFH